MTNELLGTVAGHVIQAHHITGDVHVGAAAPAHAGPPRQLPPRPRFINRLAERELLWRWIHTVREQPRVVVITGQGGVGKTAFAVDSAHAVTDRFPDGQLYLDLGAFSPHGPMAATDVLGQFLRSLGVPAGDVPATEAERVALYRSATAALRLLVVLDNAATAGQVRPLIPSSPRCVVVITSRSRLSELVLDGAHHLPLDCFTPEHAVDLLAATLGDTQVATDRAAADQIVALCRRLPLALRVAAALVATDPAHSLPRLARELQSRSSALALSVGTVTVGAVLDMSYDQLSAPARLLYRVMAAHPGGRWCLAVAAAALGHPLDEVERTVRELAEANLVSADDLGRFAFHDLVREHAARLAEETLPAEQRDTAARAMAVYYRDRCVAADATLRPAHFAYQITDTSLTIERKQDQIAAEAALDGIYVLRASVPAERLDPPGVVFAYKNLSHVERDFRIVKADDLDLRPIYHRLEERVTAHVLICMLARYLVWHLRKAWAPLTFTDEAPPQRTDPVAPAQRSTHAEAKASFQHDELGNPHRSLAGLLDHLATLTRNQVRFPGTDTELPMLAEPTPDQRRAFELINSPIPLQLK